MLAIAMTVGMTGCGSTANAPADVQEETTPEEPEITEDDPVDEAEAEPEEDTSAEEEEYADFYVEDTDITPEELREVNNPLALMKEHQSLGFKWENYDADEKLQSTMEAQFIMFEGKLWYDARLTDSEGNKTYYSDYEADDTPGATYCYQEDVDEGDHCLTLYPAGEYQYWVSQRWMQDLWVNQEEEITDISTQDGAIILQVRTTYTDFQNYFDTMYYVDPDTKLVLYREDTWYDSDGTLLSVDKYTPLYDEPYVSNQVARSAVTDAEDTCDLTVVFNPNEDNEEVQKFTIAKGTLVNVVSENNNYTFYDTADCTEMIDTINTEVDQQTIYVQFAD